MKKFIIIISLVCLIIGATTVFAENIKSSNNNTEQIQQTQQTQQVKTLHLSQTNKKILGVCGGIAEYYNIDATTVRIGFVLFSLLGGSGVLVYLVMAIIMS